MSDALCTRLQQQVVLSGTAPSSESLDLDCVIDDILSRLPAKSLLRFRCVCKAWRALISDPYFIRKHLSCIDTKISTSYSLLIKEQIFRSAEYEAILKCLSHDGPLPSRRLDFLSRRMSPPHHLQLTHSQGTLRRPLAITTNHCTSGILRPPPSSVDLDGTTIIALPTRNASQICYQLAIDFNYLF
ncbi:putative F-box protein At3g24700 isoform X3 [Rosa rugosa]|uniref:putative F-box protein At3g24700 isoform X3 n=1 Tax=Rosa rugosa TaxID=74645 RepID=UPI002B4172E5|nr:putative F-box protein At3g24700 isoform X3 [Rosa rugosa]